jgi:hypothetical protein
MTASPQQVIVRDASEAQRALLSIGLSVDVVRDVAIAAASARADAIEGIDAASAPGMLSYLHGTRAIRYRLLQRGWRAANPGNVASTVNDDLGIQLVFQNVVQACREMDPEPFTDRGPGSRRLVAVGDPAQQEFWARDEVASIGTFPTVWLLCVSATPDRICAEVSQPMPYEAGSFQGFYRRIWVVDEEPGPTPARRKTDITPEQGADFEVRVSRKT